MTCHGVITLLNKTNLLRLTIALKRDVINNVDSAVDKLLFWKKGLENELSVCHIKTMKIFCFDFFLSVNSYSIKQPKLRDVE
jgi:hypothetical protein